MGTFAYSFAFLAFSNYYKDNWRLINMPKRIYETLKSKFGILKMPIKVYEELTYLFKIMIYSIGEVSMKAHFPIIFTAFQDIFESDEVKQVIKTKYLEDEKKKARWRRL